MPLSINADDGDGIELVDSDELDEDSPATYPAVPPGGAPVGEAC